MEIHKLYSFQTLLQHGIDGDNFTQLLIPTIQRGYAQGRSDEQQVRDGILKEMFDGMAKEQTVEFSFIYGSRHGESFELLDGQQRLTTLFLLHLYIYVREQQSVPTWFVNRFSYATRKTSHDFIQKLTELQTIATETKSPSALITSKLWYTQAYRMDSSVQAMLIMLDAIHQKYNQYTGIAFASRLNHLQFYCLPLEKFGLTEELYIKMNARGLKLTPFENFKADLEDYYKPNPNASDNELQSWLQFATKFDIQWIDIFWNAETDNDKDFNDQFFRFFYRYCAIIHYTHIDSKKNADEFSKDPDYNFFTDESEKQSDEFVRYKGFLPYARLCHTFDLKTNITRILDFFLEHKNLVDHFVTSPWSNKKMELLGNKDSYKLENVVIFAALTLFIANYETLDEINFKRWKRITWNALENYRIDSLRDQINLVRELFKVLKADKEKSHLYETLTQMLANKTIVNHIIKEEATKAQFITNNHAFLPLFIEFEQHPFFKGFADCILSQGANLETIQHRIKRISPLFNEKGINKETLPNHILSRAIILSCQKEREFEYFIIKETADRQQHLKSRLREKDTKHMLHQILDSNEDINVALQKIIDQSHSLPTLFNNQRFALGRNRLCDGKDLRIWNWIEKESTDSKHISLRWAGNALRIHVLNSRTPDKAIHLSCDRQKHIPQFIQMGYNFINSNQQETHDKYGYYFGFEVKITKTINDKQIRIEFKYDDTARIYINNIDHFQKDLTLAQTLEKAQNL